MLCETVAEVDLMSSVDCDDVGNNDVVVVGEIFVEFITALAAAVSSSSHLLKFVSQLVQFTVRQQGVVAFDVGESAVAGKHNPRTFESQTNPSRF